MVSCWFSAFTLKNPCEKDDFEQEIEFPKTFLEAWFKRLIVGQTQELVSQEKAQTAYFLFDSILSFPLNILK